MFGLRKKKLLAPKTPEELIEELLREETFGYLNQPITVQFLTEIVLNIRKHFSAKYSSATIMCCMDEDHRIVMVYDTAAGFIHAKIAVHGEFTRPYQMVVWSNFSETIKDFFRETVTYGVEFKQLSDFR